MRRCTSVRCARPSRTAPPPARCAPPGLDPGCARPWFLPCPWSIGLPPRGNGFPPASHQAGQPCIFAFYIEPLGNSPHSPARKCWFRSVTRLRRFDLHLDTRIRPMGSIWRGAGGRKASGQFGFGGGFWGAWGTAGAPWGERVTSASVLGGPGEQVEVDNIRPRSTGALVTTFGSAGADCAAESGVLLGRASRSHQAAVAQTQLHGRSWERRGGRTWA
jgi:hypothetical protein